MGQKASIDEMLMKLGLQHANSVTTPIELDYDNDVHDIEPLFPKESRDRAGSVQSFQSIVGSLLWLARCSHPDIAYAVHRANHQAHASTLSDRQLTKRIAKYLKGTKDDKPRLEKIKMRTLLSWNLPAKLTRILRALKSAENRSAAEYSPLAWRDSRQDVPKTGGFRTVYHGSRIRVSCTRWTIVIRAHELLTELELYVPLPMTMGIEMNNQAAIRQLEYLETRNKA